ncbi:hypothetical protein C5E02_01260 [Rathayibacter rathayi]|uniref:hypothetical protein n=1 Tax=Rathayibacter rathayi TaxID=33887 RepID=UPI000BCA331C|nr:hypothetical protein [Rathayibacter rathayi]AZZ48006.1 hypothetical protein C1O28_01350 [Rathayibacter rathayi]MWV74720.1 hypothetical protein [Rathayibacter rathayi NCPPB 2980 = VKM Ac-1601]PPF50555.1 hypothetical protein C5C08_04860 [Rathayibacter rathayi]PPG13668.1 hypothetical protein C5C11_06755 [Rathayibacter rathayi]PPG45292.1 hypothetical protein C5C20_04475 [Rathayibacter rathayi]
MKKLNPLSPEEKLDLLRQPTIRPSEWQRISGQGKGQVYAGIADGQIPSIRIGRSILLPTAPLRRLLGIEQ